MGSLSPCIGLGRSSLTILDPSPHRHLHRLPWQKPRLTAFGHARWTGAVLASDLNDSSGSSGDV